MVVAEDRRILAIITQTDLRATVTCLLSAKAFAPSDLVSPLAASGWTPPFGLGVTPLRDNTALTCGLPAPTARIVRAARIESRRGLRPLIFRTLVDAVLLAPPPGR